MSERNSVRTPSALLGQSNAIREIRALIAKLAPLDIAVLIEGPTGAGKELVAQALHSESRRTGSFVPVNLSAINSELFESAVFGHKKGAFTGAAEAIPGYLMEADQGTVFLDELSAIPRHFQPKLLRTLESKRIRPLGGQSDCLSMFRLVSASNVPVETLVARGLLRVDMAHRLAAATIDVPPLAERKEDIGLLARHFASAARHSSYRRLEIDRRAILLLEDYPWPGNVRELKNVIESAVALAESSTLTERDVARQLETHGARLRFLEQEIRRLKQIGDKGRSQQWDGESMSLAPNREAEREKLMSLIAEVGDVQSVASALGKDPSTIYRRMRVLGIAPPKRRRRSRAGFGTQDSDSLVAS